MEPATNASSPLGVSRVVGGAFEDAIGSITAALKEQGFGILSDIDVAATLKAKLDVTIEPYRILGACSPQLAHRALSADRSIGLLLPCNVVVRELEPGRVEVSVVDPGTLFALAPAAARRQVPDLPAEARARLVAALEALAEG